MEFFDSVFADQDRQRREQLIHGVVIALVTGRMDDGTFELSYLSMGQNAPSAPARMLSPNAGSKRGTWFMPEVGDEVVVAFEGGDTNSPIILGALWNNQSPPPDQAKPSPENNIRTIVSRSGHEITLDDTPAAGKVTVKTKEGRTLTLDDTPPGKITLESPMGLAITLDDATGTLTLRAPTAIRLESATVVLAAGGISMAPGATPGTGTMNVEAPMSVSLKSAAISLDAAMITLRTTGNQAASMVVVEDKPFGLHTHGPAPVATPPVTP
jgi:uncharacterized protein involved in type VI secretion and phage assembly